MAQQKQHKKASAMTFALASLPPVGFYAYGVVIGSGVAEAFADATGLIVGLALGFGVAQFAF